MIDTPTDQAATPTNAPFSVGVARIDQERRRQIVARGWTPDHDAQHAPNDLWRAGIAYATGNVHWWPWDRAEYQRDAVHEERPTDRDLIRAGALIAAELDRRHRHRHRHRHAT